jgi:hypothetical protein
MKKAALTLFIVLFVASLHCQTNHHAFDLLSTEIFSGQAINHSDSIHNDFGEEDKNTLTFAINEFISGSIGPTYERFFAKRHSFGAKSSVYLFGWGYLGLFSYNMAHYRGIKISPFYRYYVFRNQDKGVYLEAKATYAYIDFSKIYYYVLYSASYRGFYASQVSNSFGFGVTAGVNFKPLYNRLI